MDDGKLILKSICGIRNPTYMLAKGVTLDKLKLSTTLVSLLA